MRWSLLVLATLAACAGLAQSDEPRLVKLNVAAIDANGEPVTDLTLAEIHIREDGRPRHIAFFRFTGSKRPLAAPAPGEFASRRAAPPTVILLDRLNERLMTTAMASTQLSQALKGLETAAGIYIYILTNHGELYPVRRIPGTDAEALAAVQASPTQLAALLDDAVRKLRGFRDDDELDLELRFSATFRALNALGGQMTSIAGRKSLIWITHGLPLVERVTRDLSASAALSEIAIYTVDQSGQGAGAEIRVAFTPDSKTKTAHFRIRIDPEDLLLMPRNNHYQGHLRLVLASYSGDSLKTSSRRLAININFTEDQFQRAAKDGLVVPQDMQIPDQVQKIRIIVYDRGLRSVGSVTVPITSLRE